MARSGHPHPGTSIVHEPGGCRACDLYPFLQAERMAWAQTFDPMSGTEL